MSKKRSDLRILLLQIRDDPRVRQEEHHSFSHYSGLPLDQIDILNVFDTPMFHLDVLKGYHALFVGGASEASVLEPERYPFLEPAKRLLLSCIARGFPVFASCFGFQLTVRALGGLVIRDEGEFEMGTVAIRLTPAAGRDLLFKDTPDLFLGVSVHQERAIEVPPGCITLAYTHACPHAFQVKGKPFWAFQFHPEVDRQRLVERLTIYRARYTEGDDHLEQVLASAGETPESNRLLQKFVDRVLLA
jgi:GMP synthase (glutamine-hydrolysing)